MNKLRIISLLVLVFCFCLPAQAEQEMLTIKAGTSLQEVRKLHPNLVKFPSSNEHLVRGKDLVQTTQYSEPTKEQEVVVYIFRSINNGVYKYWMTMVIAKDSFEKAREIGIQKYGKPILIKENSTIIVWPNTVLVRVHDPVQIRAGYRYYLASTYEVSQ